MPLALYISKHVIGTQNLKCCILTLPCNGVLVSLYAILNDCKSLLKFLLSNKLSSLNNCLYDAQSTQIPSYHFKSIRVHISISVEQWLSTPSLETEEHPQITRKWLFDWSIQKIWWFSCRLQVDWVKRSRFPKKWLRPVPSAHLLLGEPLGHQSHPTIMKNIYIWSKF